MLRQIRHSLNGKSPIRICTIHDLGQQDAYAFIVMELLAGLTLKHVIAGRAVELETLLSLGIEIADAFDADVWQGNCSPRHQAGKYFRHQSGAQQRSLILVWRNCPEDSPSPS